MIIPGRILVANSSHLEVVQRTTYIHVWRVGIAIKSISTISQYHFKLEGYFSIIL